MLEKGKSWNVLDHGYVKYLDHMGSDEDIVDAARISYDRRGKTEDRALIRYLLRNRHTSPFEMCELKLELSMPIFVARQWVRHRTASLNEVSGRYTQLPDTMFVPVEVAMQSTDNKQGRGRVLDHGAQTSAKEGIDYANTFAYRTYEDLLADGVSREIARGVLPLNTYTKFVWKIDLHNLMHFLKLRIDAHAQLEIRVYAEVIENIIFELFPITAQAYASYIRDAVLLSSEEYSMLIGLLDRDSVRKQVEDELDTYKKHEIMSNREITEFKRLLFPFIGN